MPRSRNRRTGGGPRICAEQGCETRLSVYNDADHCSLHHTDVVLRTRGRHIA